MDEPILGQAGQQQQVQQGLQQGLQQAQDVQWAQQAQQAQQAQAIYMVNQDFKRSLALAPSYKSKDSFLSFERQFRLWIATHVVSGVEADLKNGFIKLLQQL